MTIHKTKLIHKILGLIVLFLAAVYSSCSRNVTEVVTVESGGTEQVEVHEEQGNAGVTRIGVISSDTSHEETFNSQIFQAGKFFLQEINERGGIRGKRVEVIEARTGGTAIGAREAAARLIDEDVVAVVGALYSSETLAIAELLEEARVPLIVPASTNPEITLDREYVFRTCFNDIMQAKALAEFAFEILGLRQAVIIEDTGQTYSIGLSRHFAELFTGLGGRVSEKYVYLEDITDVDELAASLKQSGGDFFFLPTYEHAAAPIIKAARSAGVVKPFLGGDSWSAEIYDYLDDEIHGCYSSAHIHPEELNRSADPFYQWLTEHHPADTYLVAFLAYDALDLLSQVMDKNGNVTRDSIKHGLQSLSAFDGVLGTRYFDHNGDAVAPVTVLKYQDRTVEEVAKRTFDTLDIGVILGLTGDYSLFMIPSLNGITMAADDLNYKGFFSNSWIRIISFDNQSTALGSKTAATEAIEWGVDAVIGPFVSPHALAAAPALQEAGTAMISPSATNPEVTKTGDFIFRASYSDSFQGELLATFARHDLEMDDAAVLINRDNKYTVDLAEFFIEGFESSGGNIVYVGEYLETDADFLPIIEEIKRHRPDVVFLPDNARLGGQIIKQARLNGVDAEFLGGDTWSDEMYAYGDQHIVGCFFSTMWHPDIPLEQSRAFVKAYTKRFGPLRNYFVPLAYDSVKLLAEAAVRAESSGRTGIRDALEGLKDFEGVTGLISFDDQGDPLRPAVIMRFGNEQAEFIKTVQPE